MQNEEKPNTNFKAKLKKVKKLLIQTIIYSSICHSGTCYDYSVDYPNFAWKKLTLENCLEHFFPVYFFTISVWPTTKFKSAPTTKASADRVETLVEVSSTEKEFFKKRYCYFQ